MNFAEFGQIIQELRKNSYDEYGKRMTRETLCQKVHLTLHQLGRLERGERKYLDNQTLLLLAKTFNLTNLEQKEFLIAAAGVIEKDLYNHGKPQAQLNDLIALAENLQVPAYIVDDYADLLAANRSVLNLYNLTPEIIEYARSIPFGFNAIYYIYSSRFGLKDIIDNSTWKEAADLYMLFFRRSTLRLRHTEYFKQIFRALIKEKQFDIDWHSSYKQTEQLDITYQRVKIEHPAYGLINYTGTETKIQTNKGNLYLMIYSPSDRATLSLFTGLLENNSNTATRLAPWPEKKIIPD